MVPDSIRNHPFWDGTVDPYDQAKCLPNFKDFILKEYGYYDNPTHATPTGTPPPMASPKVVIGKKYPRAKTQIRKTFSFSPSRSGILLLLSMLL